MRSGAPWRRSTTTSPAYVLRVNPKGVVCARHVGPATEEAVARILGARCEEAGGAP